MARKIFGLPESWKIIPELFSFLPIFALLMAITMSRGDAHKLICCSVERTVWIPDFVLPWNFIFTKFLALEIYIDGHFCALNFGSLSGLKLKTLGTSYQMKSAIALITENSHQNLLPYWDMLCCLKGCGFNEETLFW